MKYRIIFFFFLTAIAFSCGKKAVDETPDYVGTWYSKEGCYMKLTISASSHGSWGTREYETDCRRIGHSGIARVKNGRLHIGHESFDVTLPPSKIDTIDIPRSYYPYDPPSIPEKSVMKMVIGKYDTLYKVME